MQKIFLFVILVSSIGYAQDITTLKVQFNSKKYTDLSTRLPQVDLNRIVIDKKAKLTWQDGHGVAKYILDIKDVTGTMNVNGSGQITYQLSSDKASGRAIVKKTGSTVHISLLLVEDGAPRTIEFDQIDYTTID